MTDGADESESDNVDLQSLNDADLTEQEKEELWENRGGHDVTDASGNYQLADNVAHDLIKYVRSNTIRNEQQFLLVTLGYLTGYFTDIDHFVSGVLIGTSSSGKSHLQKKVEDLFHGDHMYQATTGTEKSLIYDGDWEKAYVASMDELNKPSETLIEFLKSVHGDDEEFVYKLTPDSADKRENEEIETITRTAKPYWFLYAQFDSDFEMWNRLLKIPVHESESKNRMVGRLAADHYHIQSEEGEAEYGYDFNAGTEALQTHIASIPGHIKNGNIPGRVFLPNGDPRHFDWDVWDAMEPILNHGRSEVNRVYDMVFNLVRASALLNHKNREVRYMDVPNHEPGEYIIAEPQDVANVLSCRNALLATTHELDDKKRNICSAIDYASGKTNECEMSDIVDALDETDMSMLSRPQLRKHLEVLYENYLVDIHKGAAESGNNDLYKFHGFDELGFADVYEYQSQFTDCFDPVDGEPFLDSYESTRKQLESSGQDLTGGADTEITSGGGGQKTLTGGPSLDIDLRPHEEAIRECCYETLDGTRVQQLDDVPIEAMLGLTDVDNPDRGVDVSDSPLDPTHGCWYQPDKPDDWVEDEQDARRNAKDAIRALIEKQVIIYDEVHEVNKSSKPVDVTFAVLSSEDV
jgi:DNA-binding transcriptional ArsR family regulator